MEENEAKQIRKNKHSENSPRINTAANQRNMFRNAPPKRKDHHAKAILQKAQQKEVKK